MSAQRRNGHSQSTDVCRALVMDMLATILGEEQGQVTIKPVFGTKRPAEFRTLGLAEAKQRKVELEQRKVLEDKITKLEGELHLVENNLRFVSSERDHWRSATDLARKEGEKMAGENNQLSLANMELTEMVEEQGRVCTVLAGELVELIWSLTSRPESSKDLQQFQVVTFCRLARQVVEQFMGRDRQGGKQVQAEEKLVCAMLGSLVNLSSREETLVVLLNTEEGKMLVAKVGEMMVDCQDQNMVQLGFMLLANIFKADFKFQSKFNFLDQELVRVVGRWARGERSKLGLQQVATKLGVLLEMVEGVGGETEQ